MGNFGNENEFENMTLKSLEGEIRRYMTNAAYSLWEIGRRLRHARDKGLVKGSFAAWVETLGLTYDAANRMLYIVDHLPRLEPYQNLGLTALYLVASIDPENRWGLKHLPGGVDKYLYRMTVNELRYFKHQLSEAQQVTDPQPISAQPAGAIPEVAAPLVTTSDVQARLEQVIATRDATIVQLQADLQKEREQSHENLAQLHRQYGHLEQFRKGLSHVAAHTTTYMPDLEAVSRLIEFAHDVSLCLAKLGRYRFVDDLSEGRNQAIADGYRKQVTRIQTWVQSMQAMLGASEADTPRDVTPDKEGKGHATAPGPVVVEASFREQPDTENPEYVATPAERQAQLEAGCF